MKKIIFLLCLISSFAHAQKERVQIKGTIVSTTDEPLEGITIFNLNNLEGTITNEQGIFFINVMEGDQLNFDAIQFEAFTLKVGASTIKTRIARISLNEGVNTLDEVIIKDNLMTVPVTRDVPIEPVLSNVDPEKLWTRPADRMENTFSDRVKQPDEYPIEHTAANQSSLRYSMFNLVGVLGALLLSESINNLDLSGNEKPVQEKFDIAMLKNKFGTEYLSEYLDLNKEYLYEYMYFAMDNGLTKDLLKPENELDLLQFLSEQGIAFKEKKGLIETPSKK